MRLDLQSERQFRRQRPCNSPGNVVLHVEDVAEHSIVGCRPKVSLVFCPDQVYRDADALSFAPNTSFDDIVGFQFPRDLADGFISAHALNGRRSGDYPEAFGVQLRELRDKIHN